MTDTRRAKTRRRALAVAAAAMLAASAFTAGGPPHAVGGGGTRRPLHPGLATFAPGGAGNAVDGGGTGRTLDSAVLMLAKERGISVSEAQQRMGWQQKASDLQDAMASALGPDRFGGLWIGLDDDRIKVGVTGGGKETTATR